MSSTTPNLPKNSSGWVQIRGAREHNLKNIDIDIPRDAFVVFTGVSGSGKSSLAFGTIFAEAQRRYFESVAPYARRLLNQVGAPDIDSINGLPPAVALRQSRGATSSRSTVGTITALSNVLRMLYSRAGLFPEGAAHLDSDAFSPNTVVGACPTCHGQGVARTTTEQLLVPDPTQSIRQDAIAPWPGAWLSKNYREILIELGYDIDLPWQEMTRQDRDWILYTDEDPIIIVHPVRDPNKPQETYRGQWISVEKYLFTTFAKTKSEKQRTRLEPFFVTGTCPTCHGKKLTRQALAVTFEDFDIAQLTEKPLDQLHTILTHATQNPGSGPKRSVTESLGNDLLNRLNSLLALGLGHLTMDRASTELSSGELQRLRLATQLTSGLFGVVYVLDEPSAGLHPADAHALYAALRDLITAGNSLFVVEHDLAIAARADWIVDIGPRAGIDGGTIVYNGPPEGLKQHPESITAQFMFPTETPTPHTPIVPTDWLTLNHLTRHNLKDITVNIPLNVMTAITGVSGSGKTSLLTEILDRHIQATADPDNDQQAFAKKRVISIDQKPIGRSPRSNLATYTGLFDGVRQLFAQTPEAINKKFTPSRFSFNVKGGRCETCQGEGYIRVELLFLPEDFSPCPTCHGTRYNPETLTVHYNGLNIAQVLALSVKDARPFFTETPAIARALDALINVGLDYLTLGQPATELSGGEAQRIKLATELQRPLQNDTIYILDEPTAGLHPANVLDLTTVFRTLVTAGSTVILVEHNMAVVAAADHTIELGPAGGNHGGTIIATSTPAQLAKNPQSRTAPYLSKFFP